MIDFLFSLPLWLLGAVLTTSLGGFALIGLWLARRRVRRLGLDYEDAYYAAAPHEAVAEPGP